MATISNSLTIEKGFGAGMVSDQVKSHANDPLVVKKVEEAAKTIQNVGLPSEKKK
ncbi:hypothetical protein [Mucilaginibacter celer]|uniref:hypothetical protein n=1 Tax=Mucilaginibacter celer TaxID=2305508 RepID=UPI0013CEF154|nr:hypothetical protein [Mucilaginibacter celer]